MHVEVNFLSVHVHVAYHIQWSILSQLQTNPLSQGFQASWFRSWTWLHYDKEEVHVLCYFCCKALKKAYFI